MMHSHLKRHGDHATHGPNCMFRASCLCSGRVDSSTQDSIHSSLTSQHDELPCNRRRLWFTSSGKTNRRRKRDEAQRNHTYVYVDVSLPCYAGPIIPCMDLPFRDIDGVQKGLRSRFFLFSAKNCMMSYY